MMMAINLVAILCLVISPSLGVISEQTSLDFVVVADFGNFRTQVGLSEINFDKMESLISNSREQIDGVFAPGDILYAQVRYEPTLDEVKQLFDLFRTRPKLSQLPIYHIRGNHDISYPYEKYLSFQNEHNNWLARSKYYYELFELNDGTKNKILFLFLDSSDIICAATLNFFNCTSQVAIEGLQQMQWISTTFKSFENDTSIVWRSVVLHHPFFHKQAPHNQEFLQALLPTFVLHKVDFIICGEEHMQMHSFFSRSSASSEYEKSQVYDILSNQTVFTSNQTWTNETFFKARLNQPTLASRQDRVAFKKSENLLHQFLEGSGGKDMHVVGIDQPNRATFTYIQNQYFGFSTLKITSKEIVFEFKSSEYAFGVDYSSTKDQLIKQQYTVVIENDDILTTSVVV